MAACAQNLTPVTLELGGKSPAVIDPNYPLDKAVERIMFVKQFNAGQICTTVDYTFVHQSQLAAFIQSTKTWVKQHCPDIHSKDYTSIIDDTAFVRLVETVDDAQKQGATIINLSDQEADATTRKFPLTLILDTTDEMTISQRETFGPIMMVKTYQQADEVINYIRTTRSPSCVLPI